ncbi:MAG: hypothetical protein RMK57_01935 [Bryobacterales bacterium]|nr:hypothetical protein [Bryobacteraceae bacterium]MDW8353264.1 hypothetical protein [Bryobacterales bacterium]
MKHSWLVVLGFTVGLTGAAQTSEQKEPFTAEQIIEKSLEASGGREVHQRLTSMRMVGTFELPAVGATGKVELLAKAPDKRLSQVEVEGFGTLRQGFDGQVAWADNPMQGYVELSGEALAVARREAVFLGDLKWRELYPKVELKGKRKLGDREAYLIELTPREGKPVQRYYDAETFLLLRTDMEQPTAQGMTMVQTEFADYKEFEGRKVPFTIKQHIPEGELILRVTQIQHNVEIDDSVFRAPRPAGTAK